MRSSWGQLGFKSGSQRLQTCAFRLGETLCFALGGRLGEAATPTTNRRAPGRPKVAPRWAKLAPRWPKDGPKMAPRWPQDGPRWFQDGSKMAQDGPKMAPDGPRMAQDEARVGLHRVSSPKLGPRAPRTKNLQKPMGKQHFRRVQDPLGGPGWSEIGSKLGQVGAWGGQVRLLTRLEAPLKPSRPKPAREPRHMDREPREKAPRATPTPKLPVPVYM